MTSRGELELAGGRKIHLKWFQQVAVYGGLLEGLPTREMNDGFIRNLIAETRKRTITPPYVVPAREEPIDYSGTYPFGEPVALPRIACTAHFESLSPVLDTSKDYSSLIIIWFQPDYAFPIEPEVLEQIRSVNWTGLAADHEY